MRKTFALVIIVTLFSACNSGAPNGSSPVSLIVAQGIQKNIKESYGNGNFYYFTLKEMYSDRSAGDYFHSRLKIHYDAAKKLEDSFGELVDQIESLRKLIVQSELPSGAIDDIAHYKSKIDPVEYDLSVLKEKSDLTTNISYTQKQKLIKRLYALRREITHELVASSSYEDKKFFFNDPELKASVLSNRKTFDKLLEKAIKQSNVGVDDRECVKKLYSDATKLIYDIETSLLEDDNILNHFSLLSNITNEIYSLRYMSFGLICSRFGGENFSFDKIIPLVKGPTVVKQGEEMQLEVFVGGLNTYDRPIAQVKEGKVSISDGKAIVKIKVSKLGVQKIEGKITVINKSGVPKTLPWTYEIYVRK